MKVEDLLGFETKDIEKYKQNPLISLHNKNRR